MSAPMFADDVIFYQRLLASMGYYKDTIDGKWGRNTTKADDAFNADSRALRAQFGELDARSEKNIATLHIKAQKLARRFLGDLAAAGFGRQAKVLSGTRTYAEQNRLYAQGRFGNKGPVVTKARGGQSNHNFGIAWDIGLFHDGAYLDGDTASEVKWYEKAAATASLEGLDWGGDWKGFRDIPHYEVETGKTVKEKRALFEKGALAL